MKKVRLDQLICDMGLVSSRERAKTTIMAGDVFVDGQRVDKPGTPVDPEKHIEVRSQPLKYVSRGGLKLEKALKSFEYDPSGETCIDCGASTGGFTDVLLQNGAKRVYAVDVGYGQLAWSLRNDERVVNMERTNVRYISPEQIPEKLDLAVMDLAFISIKLVIPAVQQLLKENGHMMCLVKPQFEAGREKVGKKGVVRDEKVHLEVIDSVLEFVKSRQLSVIGLDYSPIRGPEGNIEYLLYLKNGEGEPMMEIDPKKTVEASHLSLEHGGQKQ